LRVADHLDLAAGYGACAQHTDTLVVERIPFPTGIGGLQEREFFFGQEIRIHQGRDRSKSEPGALYHQHRG
jgi:hypothetical protein